LTCTDSGGLSSSCSADIVVIDTTAPSIACPADQTAECVGGRATVEPGSASATDNCGTPSVSAHPSGSYPMGTTEVPYVATDSSGNSAICSMQVTVSDTLAPSISLNGSASLSLECAVDPYFEAGATAMDLCAGDVSGRVTASGVVDSGAVGSYAIAYTASDPSGHSSPTVIRAVSVQDTRAPALNLNGGNLRLECGIDAYAEPGATATDQCAGDLSGAVASDSSSVNPAIEGSYAVSYTVSDPSGNTTLGSRGVEVDDSTAPAITLVGGGSVNVECKSGAFNDPGATAADACYGDLTSSISRAGSIDANILGSYPITYSVTDGAGLTSTATRTVNVVDTVPPEVIPYNPDPMSANHRMQTFQLCDCADSQDSCSGFVDLNAVGQIISIYSDEPENAAGDGDGNTTGDIVITGPTEFKLRAERDSSGNGRVYGINFTVPDPSGNRVSTSCKFTVPQSSGRRAVDNGPSAGYTVYAN
jgi:large repetitive protein